MQKLIYYDADRFGKSIKFTSSASIFSAVEDAAAGKSTYKNSENVIERIARNLSTKMQSLEAFVMAYPFQSVLLLIAVFIAVFWVLSRIVGNDVTTAQQGQNEWREYKGKNGRLD
jgi:thioredoxin domain-containing protein 5